MPSRIELSQGKYALVDPEDFEYLNQWKWHYNHGYAVRNVWSPVHKILYMHCEIMNPPKGMKVDHKNRNSLDNQRDNLRICTPRENTRNTGKIKRQTTSRYKGVYWSKLHNKWRAKIAIRKAGIEKHYHIGLFENERHAGMAYDIWAKDLFGDFAYTNFKPL